MSLPPPLPLPEGVIVTEDQIDCTSSCGLNFHIIQAGQPGKALILFCHGFPELAFSWRNILPAVAEAGYYCVAMDQRGYGRTTGWDDKPFHEVDLNRYTTTNLVRDLVCLVYRLGYTEVASIIGHDFGGVSSAMSALIRPDIFLSTIQMSHPHHAPPTPPLGSVPTRPPPTDIQSDLAALDPPRKHYKWYNSTPAAATHWNSPPQGLERYLRGYFHLKSADWKGNHPRPLEGWTAEAIAVMPEYYVMLEGDSFPETVERNMTGEDHSRTEAWLSREDLDVYVQEWQRTGFQPALNWYRAQTASTAPSRRDMLLYAGARIVVPCAFISGKQDWGNHQQPGALASYDNERVVKKGCFRGVTWIDHAGHWVQQEQSEQVIEAVLKFLKTL